VYRLVCLLVFAVYLYFVTIQYARYDTITKVSFQAKTKFSVITLCSSKPSGFSVEDDFKDDDIVENSILNGTNVRYFTREEFTGQKFVSSYCISIVNNGFFDDINQFRTLHITSSDIEIGKIDLILSENYLPKGNFPLSRIIL